MATRKVTIDDRVQQDEKKVDITVELQKGDVYVDDEVETNIFVKYSKIILPHLGLFTLASLYVLIGAVVFYHMERKNEIKLHQENAQFINDQARYLVDKLSKDTEIENWLLVASDEIDNLTKIMFGLFDKQAVVDDWNVDDTKTNDQWTFNAAIFFALTLLTTIGYGNLVPVTIEGRMFCTGYALFGVPLILLAVADIGKILADFITSIYSKCTKWKQNKHWSFHVRKHNYGTHVPVDQNDNTDENESLHLDFGYDNIPAPLLLVILIGYMVLGALLLSYLEGWNYFNAFYFSFVTLTTVGFGDIVPENQNYFMLDVFYIVFGLAITTMCVDLVGARYIEKIHFFGRAVQDARVALVNIGGKMVTIGDIKKHAQTLHRKYSIKVPNVSNSFSSRFPDAFTPQEIQTIGYADFAASFDSLKSYQASISKDEERLRLTNDSFE